MKQQQRLLILLFALCLGTTNVWAEETLTINGNASGNNAPWGTGYGSGSGTSVTNTGTSIGITYTQTARMSSTIQIKKGTSNGFYSTGVPANSVITSIAITTKTNSVNLYVSKDGSNWGTATSISSTTTKTYTTADGYLYFKVTATSSYAQITSIVVTYESTGSGSSCTKPTFTIEDKTITLEEASNLFDLSSLTTNKGGSTGAITYTCSDATVEIADNLCTITTPGTYTITATMAADDTYCEATATFTITIPCTPLTTPTGLSASATTYSTATLTWGKVTNATQYQVTLTPAGGTAKTDETTGTTYNATNLTPETTYTWTVKAIGDGTTYCDSEESTSGTFTTPAKPKYTITWSTPLGTTTTQVTQDEQVGTLPTTPKAPIGCSDKVFMGWSATNIGATGTDNAPAFITAETIPTANTTYYAIFATATESSTGGSGLSGTTIYNFADMEGFSTWGTSYAQHTHTFTDGAYIELEKAAKQTGTITDCPVSKGNYVIFKAPNGSTISALTFTCKQWSSKAQTITLHTSTDGESYTQTSSNSSTFTLTAKGLTDIVAVKFTFSSTSNQVGYQSLSITYGNTPTTTYTDYVTNCAEPTEPIITADPTSIDFGTLLQGEINPTSQMLTVTGKNLSEAVSSTMLEHFTVLGSLSDQGGTLTITPKTNEAGTFTENLTLTSTGATTVVPLSVVITPTYTIQWSVCGDIDATLTQRVAQDVAITIPEGPAKEGLVFCGWTTEANKNYSSTDQAPDMISGTITATADATYYAVFAQSKGGNTGYTKVTEARDNYAGKYLIVSEENNVAFNGSLTTLDAANNNIPVTITDGKIASNTTLDAAVFTIAKTGDAYTIQSQSGKFIGQTANDNGMYESATEQYTNTISLTDGDIIIQGPAKAKLGYNTASNQQRFRYYKASSSTGKPIQLYEKADLFNYNTNCATVEIYSISASSTTGGEITVSHTNAIAGERITVTATPEARYRLGQIVYNDGTDHTVTITDNKGSFTMPAANVTVTATFVPISVTAVAVSPTTVNLRVGQSQKLTLTVTPEDAFNPSVQWHSSNATVATVSVTAEGTFVVAHSVGTAILTATTQDGSNLTATVNATITEANTYTYIDALHGNATQVHAGKHTVPAFSNQREGEGMECRYLHYHFIGWTKTIINTDADTKPADLLTPGDTVDANADSTPQTYYAVWAEATNE